MGCVESFNKFEKNHNILLSATSSIAKFFNKHPNLFKTALIVNHLFRVAMMVGFMFIPKIPLYPCLAISFGASLFYRLTVEKNCAYKFALPAFFGAAAFMIGLPAFIRMINGAAFTSIGSGLLNAASIMPLALYGAYILMNVSYSVDRKLGRL